jgi:hypothetical protein
MLLVANNTITLAMSGEVSLDDFEQAMRALKSLLLAIQVDKSPGEDLRWIVEEMSSGSAMTSFRGVGTMVEPVVREYQKIGAEAAVGRLPPSASAAIRIAMSKITDIIGRNGVTSMRFETRENEAEILAPLSENAPPTQAQGAVAAPKPAIGSVRGRIQSITQHKSLHFTMYDLRTDRAISCYLEPGYEDFMRKSWGKIAVVSGLVHRHPITGEPTTVRRINPENIKLIKEMRGSWRDAIGASPSRRGEISSDAAIRRGRDG